MHLKFVTIVFLLLSFINSLSAQKIDEKFEQKVRKFKYSLYPLLKEKKQLDCQGVVDSFIKDNSDEIYKLQRAYLKKYKHKKIDTCVFQKDSNLALALANGYDEACEDHKNTFTFCGKGSLTLSFINPVYYAYYLGIVNYIYILYLC